VKRLDEGSRARGLTLLRARARAPRIALFAVCAVLSLLGLRALVAPVPSKVAAAVMSTGQDLSAEAFAEGFARAYLSWDVELPEAHERAVAQFVGADVDAGAGLVLPPRGSQRVRWATVAQDGTGVHGRRMVTVAAVTSNGPVWLAVTVARDHGALFVPVAPAIVGGPPSAPRASSGVEAEVEDRGLRLVAARVVRNFLAGERDDLAADLAPHVAVSPPAQPLKPRSTDAVTWVTRPRRVAVAVTARERSGAVAALRYELDVRRMAGRWVVTAVHTNPAPQENTR